MIIAIAPPDGDGRLLWTRDAVDDEAREQAHPDDRRERSLVPEGPQPLRNDGEVPPEEVIVGKRQRSNAEIVQRCCRGKASACRSRANRPRTARRQPRKRQALVRRCDASERRPRAQGDHDENRKGEESRVREEYVEANWHEQRRAQISEYGVQDRRLAKEWRAAGLLKPRLESEMQRARRSPPGRRRARCVLKRGPRTTM